MNSADTDHVANYIEDNPTFTGKLTHSGSGNVFYLYNGEAHREDGPAVITQYYTEWTDLLGYGLTVWKNGG